MSCRVRSRIRSAAVRKRAEWPARIASWTRFLAIIVLPRPCGATTITFSRCGEKVEREDAVDGRPMDRLRPRPFPIGHRLEAAETGVPEPTLDAVPQAGLEFGVHEAFELHDGTPALLRGARDEVIELDGGVDEPELPQLITQRRRNRIG